MDRLATARRVAAQGPPDAASKDPFYDPPPGYQHALPGTVLRSRDVELAFLGLIPQRVMATQLLYRTTDMNGEPEATVTTVIVPADVTPQRPCPGAVVPVRDRRGVVPLFSLLRVAARREGASARWRSWSFC